MSRGAPKKLTEHYFIFDALQSPEDGWLRVEYIVEFTHWLQRHAHPPQDCVQHIQWAVNILLTLKEVKDGEEGATEEGTSDGSENGGSKETTVPLVPTSAATLDLLLQLHVMMAELHPGSTHQHQQYCLKALAYCLQLWKVDNCISNIQLVQ